MTNFINVWGPIQACVHCNGLAASVKEIKEHVCHVPKIIEQIRKIRDQFGDDKCWMDWHTLFEMLPEGYTMPPKDIRLRLEDCERYQKCLDQCTEYVPPPRWVMGKPDKPGMWLLVFEDNDIECVVIGADLISHEYLILGVVENIIKSFGPILE